MSTIKRQWEILSQETKNKCVKELISYFETEKNEEIGIIAAENLLDHFLQNAGLQLYNQGVSDSINFLKERLDNLQLDMEMLIKD